MYRNEFSRDLLYPSSLPFADHIFVPFRIQCCAVSLALQFVVVTDSYSGSQKIAPPLWGGDGVLVGGEAERSWGERRKTKKRSSDFILFFFFVAASEVSRE